MGHSSGLIAKLADRIRGHLGLSDSPVCLELPHL
jgi:hypothetical protein